MNCLDTEKFSMMNTATGWPVPKILPLRSAVPADACWKERDLQQIKYT